MKVSTRNIRIIKRTLERLYDEFNIDPLEDDVKIGDDSIYIGYPDVQIPMNVPHMCSSGPCYRNL